MSWLQVWTWLAIGTLVLGSIAVFAWFLRDAVRLLRGARQGGTPRAGGERD